MDRASALPTSGDRPQSPVAVSLSRVSCQSPLNPLSHSLSTLRIYYLSVSLEQPLPPCSRTPHHLGYKTQDATRLKSKAYSIYPFSFSQRSIAFHIVSKPYWIASRQRQRRHRVSAYSNHLRTRLIVLRTTSRHRTSKHTQRLTHAHTIT